MLRVSNLEESLRFYVQGLGLREQRRRDSETGRFTLIFLEAGEGQPAGDGSEQPDAAPRPQIELTYNWDPEDYTGGRNFGHLAYEVEDIYALCEHLESMGFPILRPPRDGHMAFLRSPDGISIELLQRGAPLAQREPWSSRSNQGSW